MLFSNDIQRGGVFKGPFRLPNSLQHYFTAKCDFFMHKVRLKVGFYSLETEYRLTRILYTCNCAILSEQIGWLPIRCANFILIQSSPFKAHCECYNMDLDILQSCGFQIFYHGILQRNYWSLSHSM